MEAVWRTDTQAHTRANKNAKLHLAEVNSVTPMETKAKRGIDMEMTTVSNTWSSFA